MNSLDAAVVGKMLKDTRRQKGWTQQELADASHISRSLIAKYEIGQRKPSEETFSNLLDCLLQTKQDFLVEGIIDYLSIHFFSNNHEKLVSEVLGISMKHMVFHECSTLGYIGRYNLLNAIDIRVSQDATKGTLFEMKGKGCRLLSGWLKDGEQTGSDFFQKVFELGRNFTRIDLTMDDYEGLLDLPKLAKKVEQGEYDTSFRVCDIYRSNDLESNDSHGTTIYFGSRKSLMHFCFYQKNYEQRRKKKIPLEECPIINRYELRFRHEKAQLLGSNIARNDDLETMIFEIINNSLCFYDRPPDKKNAKVDKAWANFIDNHGGLSLSLEGNAMSFKKSFRWIHTNVGSTLKLLHLVGKLFQIDFLGMIVDSAELGEGKQKMFDVMVENPEWFTEEMKSYERLLKEKQRKQSTAHTS